MGNFWKKFHDNHLLLMAICCIVPILLGVAAISYLGADFRNYAWLVLLLCPLMMLFMMRDMHSGHSEHAAGSMKNEPAAKKGGSCH